MDPGDRIRHRCGYHHHVGWLNAGLLLICLAGYFGFGAGSGILRFHGRDFLAALVLLAIANLLALKSPFAGLFAKPLPAAAVIAVAALQWEVIAPMYLQSTSDLLDVVAYACGALAYLMICQTAVPLLMKLGCDHHFTSSAAAR